jgi:deazaflavin-dependent oxidoreductase (nitroreductase family)
MVKRISEPEYPTGFARLLFRAPIWLYKARLGWMLGKRFLKITHTGRTSGQPREVVLEVVKHDLSTKAYYVAAAWGDKSDWVKNVRADPRVQIQVGRQKMDAIAQQLSQDESETVILDYAQRHPATMKSLAGFMGYQVDGTEADFRELGRQLLMFALKPQPQGTDR